MLGREPHLRRWGNHISKSTLCVLLVTETTITEFRIPSTSARIRAVGSTPSPSPAPQEEPCSLSELFVLLAFTSGRMLALLGLGFSLCRRCVLTSQKGR